MKDIVKVRKFLKERLRRDATSFHGSEVEFKHIKENLFGLQASNSAILIGSRGSGKTTLINAVIYSLLPDKDFSENTLIVSLNGLIHIDDRFALKAITNQMKLDSAVEGKTFASFSENLSFLLTCLKNGQDGSKRLIFLLEEFDLFCAHHNQTLLYNLFDVAQSAAQTPICVLGITSRLDVIELLEKRVKSRYSHRQIFLHPNPGVLNTDLFKKLLMLPTAQELKKNTILNPEVLERHQQLLFLRKSFDPTKYNFLKNDIDEWNQHIEILAANEKVNRHLQQIFDYDVNISSFKILLYQLVSTLSEQQQHLDMEKVINLTSLTLTEDDKITLICGLSVLEICLLISMKHHTEIYDRDPFNFEMIFMRYHKFAMKSSTMQNIEREVILKGFEHIRYLEFIVPIGVEGKIQKEYQMFKLLLTPDHITKATAKFQNLPTEIGQWALNYLV